MVSNTYDLHNACPPEGQVPPGEKYVIAALRAAGHQVDCRLWDEITPPDGHTIVFVSLMFHRQFWHLPELFRKLELPIDCNTRKCVPVVAGGHGIHNPVALERIFDRVVLGCGEQIAADLCHDLTAWDNTPHVWPNKVAYALKKDEPCSSLVARQYDRLIPYIELARGCRHKCFFCELGWTHKYSEASKDSVFSQIDAIAEQYPRSPINLLAPDAAGWPGYQEAIERCYSRGLQPLYNSMRIDSSRDCLVMSRSCRLGVEGVSERLRARVGKPYTNAAITEHLQALEARGIRSRKLFMIYDLPWTQEQDYAEFWDLLGRLKLDKGGKITVKFTSFTPMPGTPLQDAPKLLNKEEHCYLLQMQQNGGYCTQQLTAVTWVELIGLENQVAQALGVYCMRAGREMLDVLLYADAHGMPRNLPQLYAMFRTLRIPLKEVLAGRNLGVYCRSPYAPAGFTPQDYTPYGDWDD